ncbi:MAG: radical SAM protein [Promethearchaeota archaeon]
MEKKILESGFNKEKLVKSYMKSNYRIIGPLKHSAIKPCHWQEQKLLTGRANRNCYKGYFGIESETCIQNTPTLPFCNHQCVFCWRDYETASFGPEWKGAMDDPKLLVREMIRHSKNLIFEHITKKKSMDNLEIMHKILYVYSDILKRKDPEKIYFREMELAKILNTTRAKIHRAVLVLKNCAILRNPEEDNYILHDNLVDKVRTHEGIDKLIAKEVTTKEDIDKVFKNAENPKHAAISLAGEPMLYPKIGELVQEFRNRKMSTFIVTNGTHPDVLKKLIEKKQLPTQLYVTLTAPTKKDFNKISRPMTRNAWENLMETLKLIPTLPCRTVIRITAVKYLNINLDMVPNYVKILKMANPNFIDIKGFTLEASALNLEKRLGKSKGEHTLREFAPSFDDLLVFAKELEKLGGFPIIETHEPSKDILLRGSWPENESIKINFEKP